MIGYEAIKAIPGDNQWKFDPEIVGLIIEMGIYSFRSPVQLPDSSIGRVCNTDKNTPLRPEVLILIDRVDTKFRDGTALTIDLHEEIVHHPRGIVVCRKIKV